MLENKIAPSANRDFLKKVGWGTMTALALLLFLVASRYLSLNPTVYFEEQKAVYIAHTTGILTHVIGAMLAIIIGPFQFLPQSITRRYRQMHRWLGKTYMVGVLLGGVGGLYMAFLAYGGLPAQVGFALLSLAWLFSGYQAYSAIRRREIQLHRQWMIRNYALTFSGVMLRVWLAILGLSGFEFIDTYILVAWLSWVPNLMVAEWMVDRIRQQRSTV
ncbi:MAG: DUF2306 domain-containing protein [Phormidesmis sp.]